MAWCRALSWFVALLLLGYVSQRQPICRVGRVQSQDQEELYCLPGQVLLEGILGEMVLH